MAVIESKLRDLARVWARAFEPPARLSVTDWAEQNIVLGKGSAEPGPIRIRARTPYLEEILECLIDPEVSEVVFMSSTQVAKTTAMMIMLGYAVDQDPGPTLWVMPDRNAVKRVSKKRIQKLFEESETLARHVPPSDDDWSIFAYSFEHMDVDFGWSGSAMSVAMDAIRYLFKDEVDKWQNVTTEGDTLKLPEERQRTYWNAFQFEASTPTNEHGNIYRAFGRTDRRAYHVPCPHCDRFAELEFTQIKVPKDERDPRRIKKDRIAWYECARCKGRIEEHHRDAMMRGGVWCPEGCTVTKAGKIRGKVPETTKRGYRINALYSPWVTWSGVIAEFFESKDDPKALQNFVNSWQGDVWYGKTESRSEADVRGMVIEYPRLSVPARAQVLTAGIDVQKRLIYFTIDAWAAGSESWRIDADTVSTFEQLDERIYNASFQRTDGQAMQVRLACIDAGYRTFEVYDYAHARGDRVKAIRGATTRRAAPYSLQRIDKDPRTGKALKQSRKYWLVDAHYYKDKIQSLSEPERDAWHLYDSIPDDYVSQFSSEHKVITTNKNGRREERWQPKSVKRANHFWDTEVYAVAAADMLMVWALQDLPTQEKKSADDSDNAKRRAWVPKKHNWMAR